MKKVSLFVSIFLFCFFPWAYGQDAEGKSAVNEQAIAFYLEMVKENASLFKGEIFIDESKQIVGHQFYETDNWTIGNINYMGNKYQNVPLLYDLLNDQLIVQHLDEFLKIQILKDHLESFTFFSNTFINLQFGDSIQNVPPGIYHQIYNGELAILVKRQKQVKETIVDMVIQREFEQSNRYFVVKGGVFYPFKRKGQLMDILKEHKKVVKKKLRERKIKFRKTPESAIVKMVEFYEQANE